MRVKLCFSVCQNGLPAVLIVRNFDGELLYYKRIRKAQDCVCFDTFGSRNIIVTVRPYNADYYESSKFIKLSCMPCQRLYLSFDFVMRCSGGFTQDFYLSDRNYGFPVSGILRFLDF